MRKVLLASIVASAALALHCGGAAPPKPPVLASATPPSASATPAPLPDLPPSAIDEKLEGAWKAAGLTPTAKVDDGRWLRRVYLDLVGTLPTADEVRAFMADVQPDKRARKIDALLASPAYAEHWAYYWDDVLMGDDRGADVDRMVFRAWLKKQLAQNVAWDKLVYALVTAVGQNGLAGPRAKTLAEAEAELEQDKTIDGAVAFTLRFRDTPQDFAGNVSKTFLGVQIQCAQCHDHKTEPWKQTDFQKFAACFARTQIVPVDKAGMGLKRVEVRDLDRAAPRFVKNADVAPIAAAKPTALDGTAMDGNARQAVATWITKNPGFAREMVNRMWGHFLGRGFVNPVNDIRPSNPAELPELEGAIASDFALHGYDVKRLVKQLVLTEAYALAPGKAPDGGKPDLWSRFHLAPLGPEELVNAIIVATGADASLARRGDIDEVKERLRRQWKTVFDVDEEIEAPSYEGTLTQALTLLNGKLVTTATSGLPGTMVQTLVQNPSLGDAQRIEAMYLAAYARRPRADELEQWTKYVASAPPSAPAPAAKKPGRTPPPRVQAFEDVMWTLLNSSEFLFNH
jgi:hypothetical protein